MAQILEGIIEGLQGVIAASIDQDGGQALTEILDDRCPGLDEAATIERFAHVAMGELGGAQSQEQEHNSS
jgi:hypothetical protein